MEDAGVLGGEALGERGLATGGNENLLGAERLELASLAIAGLDGEGLYGTSLLVDGGDGDNLVVVLNDVVEERRAPAKVVLELGAGGQEGVQVSEVNETAVAVDIVEESELGSRVAEGGQVLDERDLHLGARQEHAGVPCEGRLLLEEKHLGGSAVGAKLLAVGNGIVHGNGHGEGGGAETGADEIKLRV